MSGLSNINASEMERYCQNVYDHYIFQTSEFLESCDKAAEIFRAFIPSGCYTNFRDMLFHFRSMMNTNEESAILSQIASIIEHSNRAVRDAEVALSVKCVTVFRILLARHQLSPCIMEKLNQKIDFMQNMTLKLRLGGMMLEGMEFLSPSKEEFLDALDSYFLCAETYVSEEFKEVVGYSYRLKENFGNILKAAFDAQEEDELRNFRALTTYNDVADLVYEAVFGDE